MTEASRLVSDCKSTDQRSHSTVKPLRRLEFVYEAVFDPVQEANHVFLPHCALAERCSRAVKWGLPRCMETCKQRDYLAALPFEVK